MVRYQYVSSSINISMDERDHPQSQGTLNPTETALETELQALTGVSKANQGLS